MRIIFAMNYSAIPKSAAWQIQFCSEVANIVPRYSLRRPHFLRPIHAGVTSMSYVGIVQITSVQNVVSHI